MEKMKAAYDNYFEMKLEAKSENESFARVVVAAFCARLDPTLEEIADIKTAVSEAVTNCIVHGYEDKGGIITLSCGIVENEIKIRIKDDGVGIDDIDKAMEPLYTSKPEQERSGMGFSFMQSFMDDIDVRSSKGRGTTVIMNKRIGEQISE